MLEIKLIIDVFDIINDKFEKLFQRVELRDKYINRIKVKIIIMKDKEFRLLQRGRQGVSK